MHMVIIFILKMYMIISIMAVKMMTFLQLPIFISFSYDPAFQGDMVGWHLIAHVFLLCFLRLVTFAKVWSHLCEIESPIVFITIRKKRGLVVEVVVGRQA